MPEDLGTTLSPKVVAGTAGAGAGAIVTTAVVWALGAGAFGAGWEASAVESAVAAVPAPLVALVALVIGVAFTFIPAWWIRDHVREEGAAAIAAKPAVEELTDAEPPADPNVVVHRPDVSGTMTYGGRAPELVDDGATDAVERDPDLPPAFTRGR